MRRGQAWRRGAAKHGRLRVTADRQAPGTTAQDQVAGNGPGSAPAAPQCSADGSHPGGASAGPGPDVPGAVSATGADLPAALSLEPVLDFQATGRLAAALDIGAPMGAPRLLDGSRVTHVGALAAQLILAQHRAGAVAVTAPSDAFRRGMERLGMDPDSLVAAAVPQHIA